MLQRWVPDSNDGIDGSLEKSTNKGAWDQFAENERLFGLKTDYDENIYTTAINKNHPQYRERIAAADKKAREIERSAASTAHVAEERVMDYVAGNDKPGENEEDKSALFASSSARCILLTPMLDIAVSDDKTFPLSVGFGKISTRHLQKGRQLLIPQSREHQLIPQLFPRKSKARLRSSPPQPPKPLRMALLRSLRRPDLLRQNLRRLNLRSRSQRCQMRMPMLK